MHSATPKHLHPLLGKRLIDWVVDAARELGPDPLVVVTSPDIVDAFDGVELAVQPEPRGTGDAVAAARERLAGFEGDVLVVSGDVPALTGSLLQRLLETHREAGAAATVLSFEPSDPIEYGRVLRDDGLSARSTPRSTPSPPRSSGPRWSGSTPTTRRASST